ncbi:MAG TPA: hypothetical protein VK498_04770 [Ferruginibacter sp.]|nr:hypothetical protein [Ferruginibacter sp.]
MLFTKPASAQYYYYDQKYFETPLLYEIGGSVGIMNCLTDLGGKRGIGARFFKDYNFGRTELNGGIYFSAMYRYAIALRVEYTFGRISADDKVLKNVTDIAKERYNRNLNFKSNIREGALIAELHPLFCFIDWPSRDDFPPRYSPYISAGIGYFSFNPQTKVNNRWVDLQPLSTEGQGFKEYPDRKVYKLKEISYIAGLGLKYELDPLVNLRLEFVYRFANTDYLDDVSTRYIDPSLYANYFSGTKLTNALLLNDRQIIKKAGPDGKRGSPREKDGYFTFNFKIGLVLGRERRY